MAGGRATEAGTAQAAAGAEGGAAPASAAAGAAAGQTQAAVAAGAGAAVPYAPKTYPTATAAQEKPHRPHALTVLRPLHYLRSHGNQRRGGRHGLTEGGAE